MRVAYASDIHYDIWFESVRVIPSVLNDCEADILILAGDIFEYLKFSEYFHAGIIDVLCERFKHVIYVDGNHEFYEINFECDGVYDLLKSSPSNFHYLRNESITISGVTFYGGTFWTNPNDWNPLAQFDIRHHINDFRLIKNMTFENMTRSHNEFVENLNELLLKVKNDVVVISHFPPTDQSIDMRYLGHVTNEYFCNQYEDEFSNSNQIKHWICGHVHHKHSFEMGNIKGHCNPHGYPKGDSDLVKLEYFDI